MTGTNDYDKLAAHERLMSLAYILRELIIDAESIVEHRDLFDALTRELIAAHKINLTERSG